MSEETTQESGSGKVFLVLGLLIGAGLGAGGGFYLFGGSSGGDGTESPAAVEQDNRVPLQAVPFERIAVPIYAKRGTTRRYIGNYFVDLHVNVRGEENQIAVKRSKSQLQHAFISAISKADLMREDSPTELDVDKASVILKTKAADVLGAGVVESVTVTKSMRVSN